MAKLCCSWMIIDELNIDEQIDLYQNCLDEDDKRWSVKEEDNCRLYGMNTMLDGTKTNLQNGKLSDVKMHLSGIHTYDILRNPIYQ